MTKQLLELYAIWSPTAIQKFQSCSPSSLSTEKWSHSSKKISRIYRKSIKSTNRWQCNTKTASRCSGWCWGILTVSTIRFWPIARISSKELINDNILIFLTAIIQIISRWTSIRYSSHFKAPSSPGPTNTSSILSIRLSLTLRIANFSHTCCQELKDSIGSSQCSGILIVDFRQARR